MFKQQDQRIGVMECSMRLLEYPSKCLTIQHEYLDTSLYSVLIILHNTYKCLTTAKMLQNVAPAM